MLRDVLTEAELHALLGDNEPGFSAGASAASTSTLEPDDRKLLHALVRNQLRLLHMIEEMQSELRMLKAVAQTGPAAKQTSAGLEPLPLPFMKQPGTSGAIQTTAAEDAESSAEPSRKEKFKRRSFW